MKIIWATAAMLLSLPALAQEPMPLPPDPIEQEIGADWAMVTRVHEYTTKSLRELIKAYRVVKINEMRLTAEVEGWKEYAKSLYESPK